MGKNKKNKETKVKKPIAKKIDYRKELIMKKRKKGKISLVLSILLMLSGITLFSSSMISIFKVSENIDKIANTILSVASPYTSFAPELNYGLIPTSVVFVLLSFFILSARKYKPFSYIKTVIFIFIFYTLYLISNVVFANDLPGYVISVISRLGIEKSSLSSSLILLLLIEVVLVMVLTPLCDLFNLKWQKKAYEKLLFAENEAKKKASIKAEDISTEKPVETKRDEKSEILKDFPHPVDVPKLSFIDEELYNKDVGGPVIEDTDVDAYAEKKAEQQVKQEIKIEDNKNTTSYDNQTISLSTLQFAKKNVEERLKKQNVDSSDQDTTKEIKKLSPAAKKIVEPTKSEIATAKNMATNLFSSGRKTQPIENNSVVNEIEDNSENSLQSIMKSGNLVEATKKNSVKDEKNNLDFANEIVSRINKPLSFDINQISKEIETVENEDIEEKHNINIDPESFDDTLMKNQKSKPVVSSSLSINTGDFDTDRPIPNKVKVNNFNSTAKPLGDAQLVDEREPIEEEVEDDDDLESAIGNLSSKSCSMMVNKPKTAYQFPSLSLIKDYPQTINEIDDLTKEKAQKLIKTLAEFKYDVSLRNIIKGPTVTMFEIVPAPGIRVNSITSLSDNIAMNLAAEKVRILAPIPGKTAVGVEIPNDTREIVSFKEILTKVDTSRMAIPMTMGRTLYGECRAFDVAQSPHMLIAGSTGSGKSVCVNSLICSILYKRTPKEVRFIMVDPKFVELTIYNGIPHLLTPVITETKRALKALDFCIDEMNRRNKMLSHMNVRNIVGYNKKIKDSNLAQEKMPYIVVIIDEFASLMSTAGKDLDEKVARLTAMSRAVGIHLVFATQRPSVDVITGVIKNNLPTRVAFAVTSTQDSRTILGNTGAENLLGKGDMLFSEKGMAVSRLQGVFLSDTEVENIVGFAKQQGVTDYIDESYFEDYSDDDDDDYGDTDTDDEDDLWEAALRIVVERKSASASFLQRRLKIGYNRAARLVENMEEQGIVGPPNGSKPRELLKYPDLLN